MKKLTATLSLFAATFLSINSTNACTDFKLVAKDGTVLISRSLEFGLDLHSNIRSSTRGRVFATTTPNNKPGMTWKAKYGYLMVDGLDQDMTVDGMNEAGLSFEYLYLPGETQYQAVPAGKENQGLPYIYLGDWILGNFKSIDEVRQALLNVYVFSQTLPALGNIIFPVHASIFDATGKGIVVEFVGGQMHISDNIGIMTNSPLYDWQVTNLRNYVNLSPYSPNPVTVDGMVFPATGQGSGATGLPGDVSPPSRFVKVAFLQKVSYPVNDATSVLNLGQHIMNNFDIPLGLARAISQGKETSESTQWVVFKDLTHKVFYYRTYGDMTLRAISFSKVDFSENAKRFKMPMIDAPYVMDMSGKFTTMNMN